jgi:NAD dependent epimerase/dehydratase family enzyme
MRSAMVMSPDEGGVFDTLLTLVKRGLGGRAGNGRQYVSWIHYEDFVRAVYWLIENNKIEDVVNLAAPNPLPNSEFMSQLRDTAEVSFGLPATKLMLEIGAVFMKTETELILKSRRVVPRKLLDDGFKFKFETWREAARNLCGNSR